MIVPTTWTTLFFWRRRILRSPSFWLSTIIFLIIIPAVRLTLFLWRRCILWCLCLWFIVFFKNRRISFLRVGSMIVLCPREELFHGSIVQVRCIEFLFPITTPIIVPIINGTFSSSGGLHGNDKANPPSRITGQHRNLFLCM